MALKLMYITKDPDVARIAQSVGVDRIIIDLERLGKAERQKNIDSVKSDHTVEDVAVLRRHLDRAELVVRVDPLNSCSQQEIRRVINNGADIVMLPMFRTAEEVKEFIGIVSGRAKTMLLLETAEAEAHIDEILMIPGIDEIHIGLNDLHLAHNMKFMFELLADGTVEYLCGKIAEKKIPYGFGGVSGIGGGSLPAERILAEHHRLGSSMVILSRSFCDPGKTTDIREVGRVFENGVEAIREFEGFLFSRDEEYFRDNKTEIKNIVYGIVGCGLGSEER